jgi:hypothetical protein
MLESLKCRSGRMSRLAIFALICACSAAYADSAAHGPAVSANTAWSEPIPQCTRRNTYNEIVNVPCRAPAPIVDKTIQSAVPEARL